MQSGLTKDTIQFTAEIPFIGLTPNAPLKFEFGWWTVDNGAAGSPFSTAPFSILSGMKAADVYTIKFYVNNLLMY